MYQSQNHSVPHPQKQKYRWNNHNFLEPELLIVEPGLNTFDTLKIGLEPTEELFWKFGEVKKTAPSELVFILFQQE